MSAETLRRAAEEMRERAEVVDDWYTTQAWATTAPMNLPIERADAAYIASWHPAVALAVANWLDDTATANERVAALASCGVEDVLNRHALAVARAYLGDHP